MTYRMAALRKTLWLAWIFAMIATLFPVAPMKADAAEPYKIVGYYPSWGAYGRNYQVYDIDATKVTHINYAFADICWNGTHGNPDPTGPNPQTWTCQDENGVINVPNGWIVMGDPWIDAQKSNPGDTWDEPLRGNFKQLIKLKEQNPNLKTLISVGGWTWSNRFSDVAASAQTRENFANSAVEFIRKYQFDGVDIDWEYPVSGGLDGNSRRPEDKQNFTLLLQKVREKLDAAEAEDGKEYLLTIASSASPAFVQNTELAQIAQILDFINIMTYDFNGGWQTVSAHNAPLYYDPAAAAAGVPDASAFNVDAAVTGHLNAGVPASKLVMGMPFYGRGWSSCQNANNGQYQSCSAPNDGTWENGSFDFYDLQADYMNKNGYTRYWNDVAKVPYLYNPTNGAFITYDNEESFDHKIAYLKSKGLGGAMFWEFSGDRNRTLLNKLASGLAGSNGGDPGGDPVDTQAPTAPAGLQVTGTTSSSVSLAWQASTDNVGVAGYTVSYDGGSLNVGGTATTIAGLAADTTYTFIVTARDAAGNVSSGAAVQAATDANNAACPPDWSATAVYTQGNRVTYEGKVYQAQWWTQGDNPAQSGQWGVWRYVEDCGGSGGDPGGDPADTQAPTAPAALHVTGTTSSSVSLAWNASTDNVGVAGYTVSYDGGSLNVGGTAATIAGLAADTTYTFTVTARDAAGNVSTGAAIQAATAPGSGGEDPGSGEGDAWQPGINYAAGDVVTYNGTTYVCRQNHTSLQGWEPPNVPALWLSQ